ncbi:hypothetical protein CAEBREN_00216 [Caenorhabditis brenneri]|uniref:Uncharacterized protein n=1 Tax=Caenorhabditis brenneri TaxID=135651 RepID=G0N7G5_CAEBE|nr:hypothetical protein CAEBREN_00216 [Caenorhabditis brenneri]
MPSHSAPLLDVFPTPGTSPNESPSDHAVQCSADSEAYLQDTDEMAQPTGTPENAHNEPMEAPIEGGNQEGVQEVEEGEEAQEEVQQVEEEEEEEVYRWTLPAIFPNGKPLRIKESEEHCLEVFLLIILQIYKECFPKLSRDKTRFGQRLKKLDPETAQEIFDDLGNEVEKYKKRVYGETNIASILDELNATEEDVFVDFSAGSRCHHTEITRIDSEERCFPIPQHLCRRTILCGGHLAVGDLSAAAFVRKNSLKRFNFVAYQLCQEDGHCEIIQKFEFCERVFIGVHAVLAMMDHTLVQIIRYKQLDDDKKVVDCIQRQVDAQPNLQKFTQKCLKVEENRPAPRYERRL